jgi:hypothetical protein
MSHKPVSRLGIFLIDFGWIAMDVLEMILCFLFILEILSTI